MKNIQVSLYLLSVSFFFIATAQAHDPSEHTTKVEKPKCAAMKNMDHSKMDANDPIMMAMMKKCMKNVSSYSDNGEAAIKNPVDENKMGKHADRYDH